MICFQRNSEYDPFIYLRLGVYTSILNTHTLSLITIHMAKLRTVYTTHPSVAVEIQQLAASASINEKFRLFIQAYVNFCDQQPDRMGPRSEFVKHLQSLDMASSDGVIALRLNELRRLGVIKEEKEFINGKKVNLIELTKLQPIIEHFANKDRTALVPSHRPLKNQLALQMDALKGQGSHLSIIQDSSVRIESLFCILDAAMKLSGRDKRKKIECDYSFTTGDSIKIKALTTTDTNSDIAYLSDERVMRALNGFILDKLESKFSSLADLSVEDLGLKDEYFFFDLYALCRRMRLRPNDQNRKIVRSMLERLRDTVFDIDASNSPYFRENFSMDAETAQYRYITEFFAKKDYITDEEGKRQVTSDRYYLVKFHTAILTNLITVGRSFISHDGLAYERQGLAHRLNNWSKAYIGVRPKSIEKDFQYVLDELRSKVIPSARMDNFERDFLSLMRLRCSEDIDENGASFHLECSGQWIEGATNIAWLYGYYYKVEWDQEKAVRLNRIRRRRSRCVKDYPVVTIWRDTEDLFVGDNSPHRQALRRQAAEIVG